MPDPAPDTCALPKPQGQLVVTGLGDSRAVRSPAAVTHVSRDQPAEESGWSRRV